MATPEKIAALKAKLEDGRFDSADDYHNTKDLYWKLIAAQRGQSEREANPMGFWFGRQSA